MKILKNVKLLEMIHLIVVFYEHYLDEFVILNDLFKIALYIIYHRHHNILYFHYHHNE